MKNLLIVLSVMAVIICCHNQNNKGKQTDTFNGKVYFRQLLKNDSIKKLREDSIAKVIAMSNAAQFEENKKRLIDLKKNFKYKVDEFTNEGWYTHKNMTDKVDNLGRKYLTTHIHSSGYIYLEDQYHSSDWIFHTRIKVKIGDNIYESVDIPTFDKLNKSDNYGSSVWENISYTDNRDNGIIKAIAECGDKPVKVRFIGPQYYSDFTLSNRDKQTIKDSYELSNLIQKVGQ
jgi:hypothetical protein